jgi:hypothetical protein
MDDLREVIARAVWDSGPPMDGDEGTKIADAALAAIKAAGFVVMPAEPTPGMLEAGRYAICGEPDTHADTTEASEDCYRAMIEASNAPT